MKAIICTQYGNPNLLEFAEISLPPLERDQVSIDVYYCGVNFPDTLIIQNKYQFKPTLPFSPGGEIAGIVKAIGSDVTHCKVGDRVMALCGWGGMAEVVHVKANTVFVIPEKISLLDSSICMYSYGTAYYALNNKALLKEGQTLLVLGASGGVGSAAIQLAKLMGAKVIAAASSDEKLTYCQSIGADILINYSTENLKSRIKEITQNKGVDIVFDPIGGSLAEDALKSIAWNGQYLIIGFSSGEIPPIPFNIPLLKGCSIHGVFWGAFSEKEPQKNKQNFIQIIQWMMSRKLTQHIHHLYALEDAPKAISDMLNRQTKGKAVIQIKEELITPPLKAVHTNPTNNINIELNSSPHFEKLIINGKESVVNFIGKPIGPGNWLTVTQKMINDFAATTQDLQWVHIDELKAKEYLPQGRTLAHGYLTMSLVSFLLTELFELKNVVSYYNYGLNKARFVHPVRVNDQIRLSAKIDNFENLLNGSVKLFIQCSIEIKGVEKPAYVAEIISVIN
ncbi:zinc-binding dehydrogenase [Sediminibacterium sp.]|uniref:zinc-binding dehydrogenase n=1 Tax=Sediminibacterium sp. TaxID=1917865 RepID=UPI003F72DD17